MLKRKSGEIGLYKNETFRYLFILNFAEFISSGLSAGIDHFQECCAKDSPAWHFSTYLKNKRNKILVLLSKNIEYQNRESRLFCLKQTIEIKTWKVNIRKPKILITKQHLDSIVNKWHKSSINNFLSIYSIYNFLFSML